MLRQVYILLFILMAFSCKEDSLLSPADFHSISGTWGLKEVERGSFGQKYWTLAGQSNDNLIFREDGAILDADSLSICCAPTSLLINGRILEIQPYKALPINPLCALVNCASCPQWEIEWKKNKLIILYCDGSREKYVRL